MQTMQTCPADATDPHQKTQIHVGWLAGSFQNDGFIWLII
jgi:hypothetical protein